MKFLIKITFIFLFISLSSCGGDDGGDPPVTLPSTADIQGGVNLYDEGTDRLESSNMEISISGSSISSLTDDQGSFILADVPHGSVTLTYEKSGYGTYKYFISNLSSNLVIAENPSLGKLSQTRVITCAVSTDANEVTISSVTNGTNTTKRYLRYFLGTDDQVNRENYSAVTSGFESDPGTNPAKHRFTKQDLIDLGFASGSQVYVKVYGDSFWANDYEDPSLNRRVFPNLNENSAEPVMFMVP